MNCTICGEPVHLSPTAQERSKKTGLPASFYTKLFTMHSDCQLKKNADEVSELIRRKTKK